MPYFTAGTKIENAPLALENVPSVLERGERRQSRLERDWETGRQGDMGTISLSIDYVIRGKDTAFW